jgi:aspartyl-tRNA(Asn)/glutamyl-tRNA(Gln) amidotransferase subunit A
MQDLFPTSLLDPSLLPPIRSALARLKELGATLHSVRLKTAPLGLSAYYVLASAEASSNLARYDGTEYGEARCFILSPVYTDSALTTGFRAPEDTADEVRTPLYAATRTLGFGNEVKKRLLLGTFALSAE